MTDSKGSKRWVLVCGIWFLAGCAASGDGHELFDRFSNVDGTQQEPTVVRFDVVVGTGTVPRVLESPAVEQKEKPNSIPANSSDVNVVQTRHVDEPVQPACVPITCAGLSEGTHADGCGKAITCNGPDIVPDPVVEQPIIDPPVVQPPPEPVVPPSVIKCTVDDDQVYEAINFDGGTETFTLFQGTFSEDHCFWKGKVDWNDGYRISPSVEKVCEKDPQAQSELEWCQAQRDGTGDPNDLTIEIEFEADGNVTNVDSPMNYTNAPALSCRNVKNYGCEFHEIMRTAGWPYEQKLPTKRVP